MNQLQKVIITIGIVIVSVVILHVVNFSIIRELVIGDECKYDITDIKTSSLFDLFYEISSNTGYHPEPSMFNFYFTSGCGAMIGLIFSYKRLWKR